MDIRDPGNPVLVIVGAGGGIALLRPKNWAAAEWLRDNCPPGEDHCYLGDSLAVENRYLSDFITRASAEGVWFI